MNGRMFFIYECVMSIATPLTSHSMGKQLLTGSQVRLSSGLGGEWPSYALALI